MDAALLPLVRVFCCIMEAGSVSGAAQSLSLTQPAVSHSLSRLRARFADPLFVRAGRGLQPTPKALELYGAFRDALSMIDRALRDAALFEPRTARRRFVLAMSDIGEQVFLPPILARLQREAPGLVIASRQVLVEGLARALATGQVDLAIGNLPDLAGTRTLPLFVETYVAVMRAGHALLRPNQARLPLQGFAAASHVFVNSQFSGHSTVERALVSRGVQRHIALEASHFTSVAGILAATDLVVTMPSRVAANLVSTYPLVTRKLPVPIPDFTVRLHWNSRHESDRGHVWLRGLIAAELSRLPDGGPSLE